MSKRTSYEKRKLKNEVRLLRKVEATPFPGAGSGYIQAFINAYIRSHDYKQLALASKRNYYRALKRLGEDDVLPIDLDTRRIHKVITSMTPGMASQYIAVGSAFFSWLGITNPFAKIKKPKCGEWEAWTIDDVVKAAQNFLPPQKGSLLLFLAAFTGQRKSDLQDMRWPGLKGYGTLNSLADDAMRKGVMLTLRQQKTGEEMFIPIPGPLFVYYAKMVAPDTDPFVFIREMLQYALIDNSDQIFPESIEQCTRQMAIIVGKPFHGLRKTCSWLLAEGECTVHEIAAVTGHRTMTMLTRYTRLAEKRKMAQSALIKMTRRLEDGTRTRVGTEGDVGLRSGHILGLGHGGEQADVRRVEP